MLKKTVYTKTPSAKDITRQLVVLDAKKYILGRLATTAAQHLVGKNKRNYVPHLDMGDFVVVINAQSIKITGKKAQEKTYSRYSGYPSGLKVETLGELSARKQEDIIKNAVKGMLPDNKLKQNRLKRLFIFPHAEYQLSKEILAITEKNNGKTNK